MKILIALALLMVPVLGNAETVQWSQGYTANCTDPIERTDNTPLGTRANPPSEISKVEYYIDAADGNTDPMHTILMDGGCKAMFVDTKQFPPGDYFKYAKVFDTSNPVLSSDYSAGILFTIQKARPKSATGIE